MKRDATQMPSYVPAGYGLRSRVEGNEGYGFLDDPAQMVLFFTRGGSSDHLYPLVIAHGSGRSRQVFAADGREGVPIRFGRPDVVAFYHDGMWMPGPGEDERRDGDVVIHWDRTDAHSITFSSRSEVWAVRGARSRGATFTELLKVAHSLPA